MPPETISHRRKWGLSLGCFGVFIALFVINYIDYLKKEHEYRYIEWDLKTITASDYSVYFDIDENFFADYEAQEMEKWVAESAEKGIFYLSPNQSFQSWIEH